MPAFKSDPRAIPVPHAGNMHLIGKTTSFDFRIGDYFVKTGSVTASKDPNAHSVFKNMKLQYDLVVRDRSYVVQWKTHAQSVPEDVAHKDASWVQVLYTYGRKDRAVCKRTSVQTHMGANLNNHSHTKDGAKRHFDALKFWKNPIRGIKHLAIKGMDAEEAFRAYKCMHVVFDVPIADMDVGLRCHMIWNHADRALRIVFEGSKKLTFRKMKTVSPIMRPFVSHVQSQDTKHVQFAPAAKAVAAAVKMQIDAGKPHAPEPVMGHPVVVPARAVNKAANKAANKPVHALVHELLKGDGDILHRTEELLSALQQIMIPALAKELHRIESEQAHHVPFGIFHSSV